MANRRGIAVAVVLFFAVCIGLFVYVMIGSNTNLGFQNKKTLGQLQAYYLAQSGLQHTILKLRLLPKETYEAFEGGDDNPYRDVESDSHAGIRFVKASSNEFSLFEDSASPGVGPVEGGYQLTGFKLQSSLGGMKHVQDGYTIDMTAWVKGPGGVTYADSVHEDVIISRFTGGIGGAGSP